MLRMRQMLEVKAMVQQVFFITPLDALYNSERYRYLLMNFV